MRQPRLTAAVLSAVAGIAIAGGLAGTAFASEVAPTVTSPANATPVAGPTPTKSAATGIQVSGKISNVDLKAGTISVTVTVNGKDVTVKLNIPKTTKVVVDGVQTTLDKLPVGAQVQVVNSNGALALSATTDTTKLTTLVGSLAKVDAKAGTVNVKLPTGDKTLPVAADAKITLDGTTVALAGLPVNATVNLVTSNTAKGQVITRIEAKRAATVKPVVTPTAQPTATVKPTVKAAATLR